MIQLPVRRRLLAEPETRASIEKTGSEVLQFATGEAGDSFVAAQRRRWIPAMRALKIELNWPMPGSKDGKSGNGVREARGDPLAAGFLIQKNERTLSGSVANSLRKAIVSGQFAPGQTLGQEFLAELFGVSRVPVREALKQLSAEGLVEIEPHKGAVVAGLSVDELDELYGIVWSLERLAAPVGVPRLTDAQLKTMQGGLEKLRAIKDPMAWYQLSSDIHRQILVASGWTKCLRMVDECRKNIGRYIAEQEFFASHADEWRKRNEALVRACVRRDVEAALAALDVMRKHSTSQVRRHLQETLEAGKVHARAQTPRAKARATPI